MGEPWGLSGPQFLALYWTAIAVAVGLTVWARVQGRRSGEVPPGDQGVLSPYELALLSGGPLRVEQTALAGLLSRGALRASRSGKVTRVQGGPGAADAVQQWVLGAVGQSKNLSRQRSLGFARSAEGRMMLDGLAARGYLAPVHQVRAYTRVHWVFLLILVVGVLRFSNGVSLDRPSAFLGMSLFFTLWIWIACRMVLGTTRTVLSRRGKAALASARSYYPAAGAAGAAVLGAVAVYGLAAYPHEDLTMLLGARSSVDTGSSSGCGSGCSSGSSCSSSGGSSCSSGSSCGGGGGGCGS